MCILCVRLSFFYHSTVFFSSRSSKKVWAAQCRSPFLPALSRNTLTYQENPREIAFHRSCRDTATNAQLDQFPRPINVVYKKFICYVEKYLINTAFFMHNSSAQRGFPLPGCPSCRICTVHIIGILASSGVYTVPVPIDFQVGQYRLEHWRPFSAGQYIFAEGNSRHSRQRSACRRGAPAKNRLQCAF